MWAFNNPFEVDEKVLKKNVADDACETKIKTKWTGLDTIADVFVIEG